MSVKDSPHFLYAAEPGRKKSAYWVRGPVWDGVWMLSALWLVPVVLLLTRERPTLEGSPLDLFYCGLTALFWIGHRLSSTWLTYCTGAYRLLIRTEPIRFVVVPVAVTAICFGILLPSDSILPWTREQRVVALAILDYLFVTYHFAAQHFGALSLYRIRAGRAHSMLTKRLDRLFALVIGGGFTFVADVLAGSVAYQDLWLDRWDFAGWIASHQAAIREGAALMLVTTTIFMLAMEIHARTRSLPRLLYILGLGSMMTIAFTPRNPFLFVVIWTVQHWILATGLASLVSTGVPMPTTGKVRALLNTVNKRPWTSLAVFASLSVLLLPFFEVEANLDGGTYYGDRIFGTLAAGLRTSSWVPVLVAAGFATGFIHYHLDRSVYRMSDPRVRAAASALLNGAAT